MRFNKRSTSAAFGIILGFSLSWLLLSTSGGHGGIVAALNNIFNRVSDADIGLLIGAFALFLLSQILRAFRWMILSFGRKVPFSLSMPVTSIHVGLGHLLPVRLSDVAFVGLFKHFGSVPVGYGTATVVFAKLLDLVAMGIIIGSAVAAGVGEMVLVAPILVIAGCLGIIFFVPLLGAVRKPMLWILQKLLPGGKTHWFDDLLEASTVRRRKGKMASALLVSLVAWISKLLMFCMLLESLGITGIPLWKIFFASGVTDLTMALPVHGLLSLGTVEAGWAAGFAMVGIEGIVASGTNIIELGFSVHLLWMFMAVFLMILAIPWLWFMSLKKNRHCVSMKSTCKDAN
ncbi:MAG: flippase-like domain-containing protein [Candidatus Aegiribacteria sp.]|nr:flippase-like domain-containing protein [Candidatus Aegiribacteria sp.]